MRKIVLKEAPHIGLQGEDFEYQLSTTSDEKLKVVVLRSNEIDESTIVRLKELIRKTHPDSQNIIVLGMDDRTDFELYEEE